MASGSTTYGESESPALQAKSIRGFAYGGGALPSFPNSQTPLAGFGIMDSSQALENGLNEASLENAAGQFVAPTTASLDAAVSRRHPLPVR